MKTKLFLIALSLLSICACTTLPSGNVAVAGHELTPEQVQMDLTLATRFGVRLALQDDENSRAYFVTALAVINASLDSKTYDPKLIQGALFTISVRELHDPKVVDAIQTVLQLYNIHVSTIIQKKLDQTVYLNAALTGLRNGIVAGLAQ